MTKTLRTETEQTHTATKVELAAANKQHEWLLEKYESVLSERNDLLETLRAVTKHLKPLSDLTFEGYAAHVPGSIACALKDARAAIKAATNG